jgi:chitin disaccharide deacetylase
MNRIVILNADDLGYDPAVSEGIVEAMRQGIVSSATLMVNTPYSSHAAQLAQDLPVGLHLNLVKWKAISNGAEMTETAAWSAPTVELELRAQLESFVQLMRKAPTHVDVHKHWHRHPEVLRGVLSVAAEQRLPVRSVDSVMAAHMRQAGVRTNDLLLGDTGRQGYWTFPRLEQVMRSLPSAGCIELMCHPGHTPQHVASSYSRQRVTELETFVNPQARALLTELGVQLKSWQAVSAFPLG